MENYYKNNWDYEVDFEADCRQGFLTAIQDNDLVRLKLLFENPHCLSELSDNGYSLLKKACKRNMTDTVEFLLSKNCDVNKTDSFEKPPLYYAIISGNMKVVQLLLKKGARVNISDNNENTVLANLLNAIENAKDGILECFIDYGFPQYDSTEECTPLHLAAFWGDMEILEKFLAKEAACDAKTLNGMTPIHFACYKGHLDIVKRLIKQGACVNELATCGLTANSILHLEHGIQNGSCSPLLIAIANDHCSLVKLLLDHGANVNAQYRQRETALYMASEKSYEMTKLLLSYCPDVNQFGNERALTDAIFEKRDINTVRCLFEYGFTVDPEYVKNENFLDAVCKLGCVEAMENLIHHGLDVNTKLYSDFSLLHLAVINKKRDLCEYLLDCKANINVKNWGNRSPFFCAVKKCDVNISKLLLERGTDRTEDITEAFNIAVCNQDLEMVEFIFENYGSINLNLGDDFGRTSLHFTVLKNPYFSVPHKDSDSDDIVRAKIAKLLLTKGSHVDSTTRPYDGLFTTLIVAATKGYKNVVEVLLENHAKVNFQGCNGISALHAAVGHDRRDILNLIREVDPILFNISKTSCVDTDKRYTDIVELLLKYGSDCDLQDTSGLTALHLAVLHSNREIIKMLLKSGCDISLKNKFGQTALHTACINNDKNLHFLLKYIIFDPSTQCCNVLFNLKDRKGLTPLIIATVNGSQKIVETLLNSGVDVNSQDGNGATALHYAVRKDSVDIVELLIKYGIDFNLQDSKNRTALYLAVDNRNLKAIEMLIKAGCDYKFQDSSGRTILHLACDRYQDRTVRVIVTSIRSVIDYSDQTFIDFLNMKDNDCLSALMIASKNGSLEIVEILLNSGANVNSDDFRRETALHRAVHNYNCTMVSMLLKFGSDVNRTSAYGHTPLTSCCRQSKCCGDSKPHYLYKNMSLEALIILENHVTKFMAAGFYICEKNVKHMELRIKIDDPVSNHKMNVVLLKDCLHELDISKKCFLYGTVSFYSIITASVDKLAKYLRNEELMESFNSYQYANRFPIYADVIFGRFKMAERRKHLREQFDKLFLNCVNCDFSRLPYVCIEEIVRNLSDDDLKVFTAAVCHFR